MTQTTLWILIAISTGIAIFLLIFNLKSWKKIKELKAVNNDIEDQQTQSLNESHLKAYESIKVIAQCMIDEQVELSEGSIRIKVLLDHVAPELHDHPPFSVFSRMYTATEHMPTHNARKQADKKLIRKLDKERFKLEEDNKEEIILASKELVQKELN
tara:strand:+ start:16250 stop:16720 length:471 start_codon:yes stop_codon:yes gene_type:complete